MPKVHLWDACVCTALHASVEPNGIGLEASAVRDSVGASPESPGEGMTYDVEEVALPDGNRRGTFPSPGYMHVFDAEGRFVEEGPWQDGRKNGFWLYYGDNGGVELSGEYCNGLAEGLWIQRDADGNIVATVNSKNGVPHGDCRYSYPEGSAMSKLNVSGKYKSGVLVEAFY